MSIEEAIHDSTLQENVLRIYQRLTEGYREYEDITDTAVGFLALFESRICPQQARGANESSFCIA